MPHPAAYIRRSYVDANSPGDISLEAQRAAVHRLAEADRTGELVEYNDWGVSADIAKSAKRTEYARLLADMEAGSVSAVYAFDVDRLYRDVRDLIRLQDAAQRHGVRVVTTAGPLPIGDGDDPAAEGFAFIGAVFGRMELGKAKKRIRAALAVRRARGDDLGHPVYGWRHERIDGRIVSVRDESVDLTPLIDAYREARSVMGACRLLNEREIKSAKGGDWHPSALARVLERADPTLLPAKSPTGRRYSATPATFAKLLRCHCGTILTPNTVRGQYYCHASPLREGHGRMSVTEAALLPLAQAEAARLRPDFDQIAFARDQEAAREGLRLRRERVVDMVEQGTITRQEAEPRLAKIADEVQALERESRAADVPAIDWGWPTAELNDALRALWLRIDLGPDMLPMPDGFVWTVPEWRGPAEGPEGESGSRTPSGEGGA